MPSLPTQSSSTPHFDSCCSPSHSQHSSTSKLKTKSDSCLFHCIFLMFVVALGNQALRARQPCLSPV